MSITFLFALVNLEHLLHHFALLLSFLTCSARSAPSLDKKCPCSEISMAIDPPLLCIGHAYHHVTVWILQHAPSDPVYWTAALHLLFPVENMVHDTATPPGLCISQSGSVLCTISI